MTLKDKIKTSLTLPLSLLPAYPLCAQQATTIQKEEKPNIVLFLVDDMGWQDTSVPFYSEETKLNQRYYTPNMEKLAEEGVLFTNAYSAPICSPTRTSLMTGQNPARHHVTNWTLETTGTTDSKVAGIRPPKWNHMGLQPDDALNLAQGLQQTGYKTIHCGKAHWGANGTKGSDPLNLGFDVNIAGHAAGGPGSYYGEDNFGNNADGSSNKPWGIPGLEKYYGTNTYLNDALTLEANLAVNSAIEENKPFYLYMAHYAIHAPIMGDPARIQKYLDAGLDKTEAAYASMIESMDASLGSIIENLKKQGVAKNTLIIFTSDNGGLSISSRGQSPYGRRDTHNYPLREGKGSSYEGGSRIPYIVAPALRSADQFNWIGKGIRSNAPIICEDIYPTILSIAGFTNWDKIPQTVDGKNTAPLFDGKQADEKWMNRTLGFHTPHQWTSDQGKRDNGYQPHTSVRKGDWKLIYFYRSKNWELYNLSDDISESWNRIDINAAKLQEMKEVMKKYMEETGAQLPIKAIGKKNMQIEF